MPVRPTLHCRRSPISAKVDWHPLRPLLLTVVPVSWLTASRCTRRLWRYVYARGFLTEMWRWRVYMVKIQRQRIYVWLLASILGQDEEDVHFGLRFISGGIWHRTQMVLTAYARTRPTKDWRVVDELFYEYASETVGRLHQGVPTSLA